MVIPASAGNVFTTLLAPSNTAVHPCDAGIRPDYQMTEVVAMPGHKGNQNAAKEDPADKYLHIRCRAIEKAQWNREARKAGMTLSEYVKSRLPKVDK